MRSDLGDVWISSLTNLWCKTVYVCVCVHARVYMCVHIYTRTRVHVFPSVLCNWSQSGPCVVHIYLANSPPFPFQWGLPTWEPSCGICVGLKEKFGFITLPSFVSMCSLFHISPSCFLRLKREKSYWNDPVGFLFV